MAQGNWFQRQRYEWIGETLFVFGFINRDHLMRKFRISQPQASLDLRHYVSRNGSQIRYDTHRKCYIATFREQP